MDAETCTAQSNFEECPGPTSNVPILQEEMRRNSFPWDFFQNRKCRQLRKRININAKEYNRKRERGNLQQKHLCLLQQQMLSQEVPRKFSSTLRIKHEASLLRGRETLENLQS